MVACFHLLLLQCVFDPFFLKPAIPVAGAVYWPDSWKRGLFHSNKKAFGVR